MGWGAAAPGAPQLRRIQWRLDRADVDLRQLESHHATSTR
jgi:hypothetical protein